MVGDSNIYVVYNSEIETSTLLNKFLTVVLDKAKFPISKIQFRTEEEYLALLKEEGSKNYVICLNKTYTEISIQTGQIIGEQPFKFFSRYYQNDTKRIYILGLLNNLDELFDEKNEALKRTTWTKLKTFLTSYTTTVSGFTSSEPTSKVTSLPIKDSLNTEVIKDTTKVLDLICEEQEEAPKEESKPVVKEIRKELDSNPSVSYAELLEFYNLTSSLLRDFDILMTLNKKIGDNL
ncbi:hypothetical protein FDH01_gp094 [Acinetobacter phage vB_AbaM_ME3]|uniref:Uncharacterized protein n=1 Tax=Acinetobacter phage vB_AbaM_ME3 TaxID=1837876 RepID=A0A172Q086_9CAUD|nr:hypothetical protein FDH01_gp094 [Acinetobacter phage vB_AbaM_ME3]AND75255.1 hypothetical protein ME3_94 [Acinetobacter phage vB_AbaM_ME3]